MIFENTISVQERRWHIDQAALDDVGWYVEFTIVCTTIISQYIFILYKHLSCKPHNYMADPLFIFMNTADTII